MCELFLHFTGDKETKDFYREGDLIVAETLVRY